MRYEYYLFDWDGCLAKTLEVWLDSYREVLTTYGKTPTDREIAHHFGDWGLYSYFDVEDFEEANTRTADLVRQKMKTVELYDGAKELLQALDAKGKKVAIVSSGSRDIVQKGIDHNGVGEFVEVFISGEDVTNHKPHPEPLEAAITKLNAQKELTIMIGDSRKDLEAASNTGVDSILMYPENHELFYDVQKLRGYKPTFEFSSFFALLKELA